MSTDLKMTSEECSAVVFYGISPNARAAESFYHIIVDWFTALGHPPDRMGISDSSHNGKLTSFARGNAKLHKNGFDGVVGFELSSSTPNAITGHGYFLTASYDAGHVGPFADVVARSSLGTLSSTSMLPIARTLAQVLKPVYGIGYTMAHKLGPELYAVGINFGSDVPTGDAYEEACNVSRWCDMGMVQEVYRMGILRDVYPWNFLTQPQLAKPVDGLPLEQWIRRGTKRGVLSPLCDGMWLWEIAESNIPEARRTLRQTDVIFDWRKLDQDGDLPGDPRESLRRVLEGQDLEDIQVLRGDSGREISKEEVRKIIKRPKKTGGSAHRKHKL